MCVCLAMPMGSVNLISTKYGIPNERKRNMPHTGCQTSVLTLQRQASEKNSCSFREHCSCVAQKERWSCDTNAHPACSREILPLLFLGSRFCSHACSFPGSCSFHPCASAPPPILSPRSEPPPLQKRRAKTTERGSPPDFLERPATGGGAAGLRVTSQTWDTMEKPGAP